MKETNINDLTTRLTDEESNIVDSIINDLNKDSNPAMPPKPKLPGQMPGGMPDMSQFNQQNDSGSATVEEVD